MFPRSRWRKESGPLHCGLGFDGSDITFEVSSQAASSVTPLDLLSASLSTCTTLALAEAVQARQLLVREVQVCTSHAATAHGLVITRSIELGGQVDEAELAGLLDIAEECAVHRLLRRQPALPDLDIVTVVRLNSVP